MTIEYHGPVNRDEIASAPLTFDAWVDARHPQWWQEAEKLGGLAHHAEFMAAWAAWDAAVDGFVRQLHQTPIRELVARVEAMYVPPPMA